jgi:hypothetical protein
MLVAIITGRVSVVDFVRREVRVDVGLETKNDCGGYGKDFVVIDRVDNECLSAAGALIGKMASFEVMRPKSAISREVVCKPFVEENK